MSRKATGLAGELLHASLRIADDLREMITEPGEMPVDGTQWDMPTAEQKRAARLPEKPARRLRPVWRSMLEEADPGASP